MKIFGFGCSHKWTLWSDPIDTNSAGHKQQWRSCQLCNHIEFRNIQWDYQADMVSVLTALNQAREETAARGLWSPIDDKHL